MTAPPSLRSAVSAHARWKVRLLDAVDGRKVDVSSADALRDDRCELGRWLHDEALPSQVRGTPVYARVIELHREFHACAGRVLALVEAGRHEDARRLMAHGESYDRASLALVSALMTWRW